VKSYVVTGASSGIGHATVLRLAKSARVFAGVRSARDHEALGAAGANIVPVYLDVTDPDSIAQAKATVARQTADELNGLVNNAGIAVAAPLEMVEAAEFRKQFDINVMGPLLVTQAFLPMIRARKGRIVTIGSIGGKMALPFIGPYAASKFAIEAMSDAWRLELAPFGIRVILIEPGAVKTPIWQRSSTASLGAMDRASADGIALYGEMIGKMQKLSSKLEAGGIDPDRVAAVVERALTVPSPRARYLVGTDARVQLVIGRLPEFIRDRMILSTFAGAK
jgi:NAD(P)-dependent dehydrogenase (short-subunit alcohol dehydrogenase family)